MRAPLATGALWVVALLITLRYWWDEAVRGLPVLADFWTAITSWQSTSSAVPIIAALTFVSYLIGSATMQLSAAFTSAVGWIVTQFRNLFAVLAGLAARAPVPVLWRLNNLARDVAERHYWNRERKIGEAAEEAFREAGVSVEAVGPFPTFEAVATLPSLSMRLWSAASEQYQELDRVRAEAAFRSGIALPLAVLGTMLFDTWWLGPPIFVLSLVLAYQVIRLQNEQNDLLAEAVRAGLIASPMITRVAEAARGLGFTDPVPWHLQRARMYVALGEGVGHWDDTLLDEALANISVDWTHSHDLASELRAAARHLKEILSRATTSTGREAEIDHYVAESLNVREGFPDRHEGGVAAYERWNQRFGTSGSDSIDTRLERYIRVGGGEG